jgi:hypothetical protein
MNICDFSCVYMSHFVSLKRVVLVPAHGSRPQPKLDPIYRIVSAQLRIVPFSWIEPVHQTWPSKCTTIAICAGKKPKQKGRKTKAQSIAKPALPGGAASSWILLGSRELGKSIAWPAWHATHGRPKCKRLAHLERLCHREAFLGS